MTCTALPTNFFSFSSFSYKLGLIRTLVDGYSDVYKKGDVYRLYLKDRKGVEA